MGWARTHSAVVMGVQGHGVEVEADVSMGLPAFTISGLPDTACRQSVERIRAGAANCELGIPPRRITINLSPASLPKAGAGLDLPIAVAVLAATQAIPAHLATELFHVGEVGLDGSLRGVPGVLPLVAAAVKAGVSRCIVPVRNYAEAALVPGAIIYPARDLRDVLAYYTAWAAQKEHDVPLEAPSSAQRGSETQLRDLSDIAGQHEAASALIIAAAGGHHVRMIGPPGAGKTMLAQCLPSLLPPLTHAESMEVTSIHSITGKAVEDSLLTTAPWVAPHHSATMSALIGGGSGVVTPGLITQAHRGVLFLDETPEFSTRVLQALRQPLESGEVMITRARSSARFPAVFQLVMAANPCPCGMGFGRGDRCRCSGRTRHEYMSKISGPLADRIDMQLTLQPVTLASLSAGSALSSATAAHDVAQARERQKERWDGHPTPLNSRIPGPQLRKPPWRLPATATADIDAALDSGALSLRGYDRVLRLAWSIADLHDLAAPTRDCIGQALTWRAPMGSAA